MSNLSTSPKPVLKKDKKELPKPSKSSKSSNISKAKAKEYRKPFYKLLAGNGCHQALGEFIGSVHEDPIHGLVLKFAADDITVPLRFNGYNNNEKFKQKCLGNHYFRGYPTTKNGMIVSITITSVDPINRLFTSTSPEWEYWHFRGLWTVQQNITVQRGIDKLNTLNVARQTGFIKKYKFKFVNYSAYSSKLTPGYVYTIMAHRVGNFYYIDSVTPFCCPLNPPKVNRK